MCSDNTDPNVSTTLNEDLKICDTKDILCDEYENNRPNLEHDPINTINRNEYGSYCHCTSSGYIDILLITETKVDESFPRPQFAIRGYKHPFRHAYDFCQTRYTMQTSKYAKNIEF